MARFNIIQFQHGKEKFSIDFKKELTIDEDQLIEDLESAAANYGYYAILKAKVGRHLSDLELQKQKQYSEVFLVTKEDPDSSRPPSDKHADATAFESERFIDLCEEVNEVKETHEMLWGLLKSYEFKINLMQTLSANNRNH